ncbi:hypothetical protein, partial [Fusobacterium sp. HC1336]|uniref:hypothetical protein n=1 Tax=Fusobacterium sp. HC1336 TaxID=3171169 RepID=UPI003F1F92BF
QKQLLPKKKLPLQKLQSNFKWERFTDKHIKEKSKISKIQWKDKKVSRIKTAIFDSKDEKFTKKIKNSKNNIFNIR